MTHARSARAARQRHLDERLDWTLAEDAVSVMRRQTPESPDLGLVKSSTAHVTADSEPAVSAVAGVGTVAGGAVSDRRSDDLIDMIV